MHTRSENEENGSQPHEDGEPDSDEEAKRPFHFDLGEGLHTRLRATAARNDRSLAGELRVAVRHYLDHEEASRPEAAA